MTIPSQTLVKTSLFSSSSVATAALKEPMRILRTQLGGELAKIEALLKLHELRDGMTEKIARWHELFCKTLKFEQNAQKVLDQFLLTLEQLLKNPISHTQIDEEPLLGSDQHTYGKEYLVILLKTYQESVTGIAYLRSPLAPEVDEPFSVRPHPIVKHMVVQWLQKHKRYKRSAEEQTKYQAILQLRSVPRLLNHAEAEIRYIAAKASEFKKEAERKREAEASLINSHVSVTSNVFHANLMARMKIANERIQAAQEQSIADADALKKRDQERREKLERASKQLREEISQLEEEIHSLTSDLTKLREDTHAMQREEKQLELAIKQLEKEIKESQASWIKGALSTVAVIAACAFTTWTLGGSAALIPTKEGLALSISL